MMSIEYGEFLTSATELLEASEIPEVVLRNAVSRAYYSAYHACLSVVEVDKEKYKNMGDHAKLIRSMLDHRNEKIRSLGYILSTCKNKRVKADYHLEQSILILETIQHVKEVTNICIGIKKRKSSMLAIVK